MLFIEKLLANFSHKPLCPDFGTPCREHRCMAFGQRKGENIDTGESPFMEWGCVKYEFMPALQIETTKAVRSIMEEHSAFRGELVKKHEEGMVRLAQSVQHGLKGVQNQLQQLEEVPNEPDSNGHPANSLLPSATIHRDERDRGRNGQSHDNELPKPGLDVASTR